MKCPVCNKEVYFAERIETLGKDWHRSCLKCGRCYRSITPGYHCKRNGRIYCYKPCYMTLYGPRDNTYASWRWNSKVGISSYYAKCYNFGISFSFTLEKRTKIDSQKGRWIHQFLKTVITR
ncbi:unnamed protein product [Schistosoma intercalatum]|nr:unnamed protein product [Schistosoma intercalatum]